MKNNVEDWIVAWNNKWIYDYWYRNKYNIAFNSEEHRKISQIDVKMVFLEEGMISESISNSVKREKDKKKYDQTGNWLKKRVNKKREDELFDMIRI